MLNSKDVEPEVGLLFAVLGQAYQDALELAAGITPPPDLELSPDAIRSFLQSPLILMAEDTFPIDPYIERIRAALRRDPYPRQGLLFTEI